MALLHLGIFHSNSFSGRSVVFGRWILTLLPGRLDVADVDEPAERRRPETRDRAAAGVEREMIAGPLVAPARRHDPGVLAVEIALLRPRGRGLVPGWRWSTGLPSGSVLTNVSPVLPIVVEGAAQQDADAEVDVDEVVGDQLAIDDDAGRDVHRPAPVGHVLVAVVADSGLLKDPQQPSRTRRRPTSSYPGAPRRRSRTGRREAGRPSSCTRRTS